MAGYPIHQSEVATAGRRSALAATARLAHVIRYINS